LNNICRYNTTAGLFDPVFFHPHKGYVMLFNIFKLAATSYLLLLSVNASAIPFASFDPRSMAMGGAGVAVADAALAPLFNPALLSVTRYSDDFSLVLPSVGIQVADSDSLFNSVDTFLSGNSLSSLQTSIDSLSTALALPDTIAVIQANAASVTTNLNTVSSQLSTLSNKPFTLGGGLATVVGIPNKKFGAAFYANVTVATGAIFQYKDAESAAALSAQTACIATAADATAANACGPINFNTNNMQSELDARGVRLAEMGFAFSREYYINRQRISLAITPKVVQAQLYEVPVNVNSSSIGNLTSSDYRAQYTMANFDLGLAKNYRNGWRAGLVIKNVIPYILAFKNAPAPGESPVNTRSSLRLMPQTRAGISYTNRWSVIALDMDLYRNGPVGLENHTQYVSLGSEINSWNWAQLRLGYRADLVDSSRNIVSMGLGFSPFGIHADIAVSGNENEAALAFQLGFRY